MIYVKLNPKKNASSFFDPSQPDVKSQSLSNHSQVIMVEETPLVERFITSKGLIESDEKEYQAYVKHEEDRIAEEKKVLASRPTDASTKALKQAHEKLQDAHEDLQTKHEDAIAENVLLKEENAKLLASIPKNPDAKK